MSHAAAVDSPMSRLLKLGGELVTPPGEPRRKFDLAHMRALLSALGSPERRFAAILIAGTNGKGSTAATLASILAAAGYTTGLYTSPHLVRVNERIQILAGAQPAAREIDDATLFTTFARVEDASQRLVDDGVLPTPPSFFETMTAIAMLTFAAEPRSGAPVDIAVLEVGMGGRLDATNVVEPLLSIITDISLDHTEWLGDTLAAIAREKAGILRANGIMITLPQHPEANQALGEVAVALSVRGVNAAEFLPARDAGACGCYGVTLDGTEIVLDSPLRGQHQQRNLALAIAAAHELRRRGGYTISNSAMETGVRSVAWPGRLEELQLPGGLRVLLDVAHNPAGSWTLRAAVSQLLLADGSRESEVARVLIFGCMRDKALQEMAHILFPVFDHVFLVELPSPRSASAEDLIAAAAATGVSYSLCADTKHAWADAQERRPGWVVCCGSVVLVGALRSLLR